MILFFDRSMGTRIPKALLQLRSLPFGVEYHEKHFAQDEEDDVWMPQVAERGWTIIGQDYKFHVNPSELLAVHQYQVGAFYIWGARAKQWDILRVFAKAFDKVNEISDTEPRPFIYEIGKDAVVRKLKVPLTAKLGTTESQGRKANW